MIRIKKSETADTRTCDPSKVSLETLKSASAQHIDDVRAAMRFFSSYLQDAAVLHDWDKIERIEWFHSDFVTGFKETGWWDEHRRVSRHHLSYADGIPNNVNLMDILEYISDCTMAGIARSGSVSKIEITDELLRLAFENTAKLLRENVELEQS
jgi:hypothetical protein